MRLLQILRTYGANEVLVEGVGQDRVWQRVQELLEGASHIVHSVLLRVYHNPTSICSIISHDYHMTHTSDSIVFPHSCNRKTKSGSDLEPTDWSDAHKDHVTGFCKLQVFFCTTAKYRQIHLT